MPPGVNSFRIKEQTVQGISFTLKRIPEDAFLEPKTYGAAKHGFRSPTNIGQSSTCWQIPPQARAFAMSRVACRTI
jgi:hypothetical protein